MHRSGSSRYLQILNTSQFDTDISNISPSTTLKCESLQGGTSDCKSYVCAVSSLTVVSRYLQAGGGGIHPGPPLQPGHAGLLVGRGVEVGEVVLALHVRPGQAGADETPDACHAA